MLGLSSELKQIMKALDTSQAVIHFDLNGHVLDANRNFLQTLGYNSLTDIKGRHHSMFVDPTYAQTSEYKQFWDHLRAGKFQAAQFKRVGRNNKEVWIQATYNPIIGNNGKPFKVVKFASDITNSVVKTKEAFDKVQALIYFGMDGIIQDANENFLRCTGYSLEEIRGQHHRIFCYPDYANSADYKRFWEALNRGDIQTGEFQRVGRGGRNIWLNASYTVRYDNDGKPCQVVKYANDITRKRQVQQETGDSINAVTAATAELTNSITEISRNMGITRDAARTVQGQSNTASSSVGEMVSSAKAMGEVLTLIQNISDQINLLALNAAIEAARAGDAGRGFAVVADEVKRLASQASSSTDKISGEIRGIQDIASSVAHSITQIQSSVNEVVETTTAVAAATEEQSAVTNEISNNMTTINRLMAEA